MPTCRHCRLDVPGEAYVCGHCGKRLRISGWGWLLVGLLIWGFYVVIRANS